MISLAYVNQTPVTNPLLDDITLYEMALDDRADEITTMLGSYMAEYYSLVTEAEILGDDTNLKAFLEETSKEGENNIFAKIGTKVEGLVKAAIEFINNVIKSIQELMFKSKTDTAKIDRLVKEHPEFKDQIMKAFAEGDLEVRDIKSFAELDKEFTEIMRFAQQASVDPKSLRGRWNAALDKFKNAPPAVTNTAKAVTATVGAIAAIATIRKIQLEAMDNSKNIHDRLVKASYEYKKYSDSGMSPEDKKEAETHTSAGYRELVTYMMKTYTTSAQQMASSNRSLATNIQLKLARIVDNLENKALNGQSSKRARGLKASLDAGAGELHAEDVRRQNKSGVRANV